MFFIPYIYIYIIMFFAVTALQRYTIDLYKKKRNKSVTLYAKIVFYFNVTLLYTVFVWLGGIRKSSRSPIATLFFGEHCLERG